MENHKRTVAEIIVDAWLPAAVAPAPLRLVPLVALPPLAAPAVKEDLDLLVLGEIPSEVVPEVRLVSRHDEQASNPTARRPCFQRSDFDWHTLPVGE